MRTKISPDLLINIAQAAKEMSSRNSEVRRLEFPGGHAITFSFDQDGYFDVKFGDNSDIHVNGTVTIIAGTDKLPSPDPMKKF